MSQAGSSALGYRRIHDPLLSTELYRDFLTAKPDAANSEELRKEAQRLESLSAAKQQ